MLRNPKHFAHFVFVESFHWPCVVTQSFCHPHHGCGGDQSLLRHPHRDVWVRTQICDHIPPLSVSPGVSSNVVFPKSRRTKDSGVKLVGCGRRTENCSESLLVEIGR